MLRQLTATRYVTPLREGGSLPGVVEADDEGTYVVKFRGAGQGPKALVAEVISGELGRRLELPVPDAPFPQVHDSASFDRNIIAGSLAVIEERFAASAAEGAA